MDGDAMRSFVVDHAGVVVPKDEVGSNAVFSNVARQFQPASALDVFFRSTFNFRSGFYTDTYEFNQLYCSVAL